MGKVVNANLTDVTQNIVINQYTYAGSHGVNVPTANVYEEINYGDVSTPIAGLTNALPASNIQSNVYTFIAQEITIDFIDTIEAINNSLADALGSIHIFDDTSYVEDGTVNNDTLPPDYNYDTQLEEEPTNEQIEEPSNEPAEEDTDLEENASTNEEEQAEEPKPEMTLEEQIASQYSNDVFTPSVTTYEDGSYSVSSSEGDFDAKYLASHSYYYNECAASARKMAHKRWGKDYFVGGLGNAKHMAANAKNNDKYIVSKEPTLGAIITFQPGYFGADKKWGHAAYVDRITYNADGTIKSITIAQTHYNSQGNYYTYDYDDIKNNISGIDFIAPNLNR